MRKLAGTTLVLLLLLALTALAARAQDLDVPAVDRGSFTIMTPLHVTGNYSFSAEGFNVFGYIQGGDANQSPTCSPCVAGETTPVRTYFASYYGGYVNLNGQVSPLFLTYNLELLGPQVRWPFRYSPLPMYITGPATITGVVRGYRLSPFAQSSSPVFQSPINLQGTVTLRYHFQGFNPLGKPMYGLEKLSYDFTQPAGAAARPEQKPHYSFTNLSDLKD